MRTNNLKEQLIYWSSVLVVAVIFSVGISYLFAWTGPLGTPPNNNVPAPINVGPSAQTKQGDLQIGTDGQPATITIKDGNQAEGKLLTSDVNGRARWGWLAPCPDGATVSFWKGDMGCLYTMGTFANTYNSPPADYFQSLIYPIYVPCTDAADLLVASNCASPGERIVECLYSDDIAVAAKEWGYGSSHYARLLSIQWSKTTPNPKVNSIGTQLYTSLFAPVTDGSNACQAAEGSNNSGEEDCVLKCFHKL